MELRLAIQIGRIMVPQEWFMKTVFPEASSVIYRKDGSLIVIRSSRKFVEFEGRLLRNFLRRYLQIKRRLPCYVKKTSFIKSVV